MTRAEILTALRCVMGELFELAPAEIAPESRLVEDLDLDSIDTIDLVVKMKELSDGKVDQDAMARIRTVGDIVDYIEQRLARSARGRSR